MFIIEQKYVEFFSVSCYTHMKRFWGEFLELAMKPDYVVKYVTFHILQKIIWLNSSILLLYSNFGTTSGYIARICVKSRKEIITYCEFYSLLKKIYTVLFRSALANTRVRRKSIHILACQTFNCTTSLRNSWIVCALTLVPRRHGGWAWLCAI